MPQLLSEVDTLPVGTPPVPSDWLPDIIPGEKSAFRPCGATWRSSSRARDGRFSSTDRLFPNLGMARHPRAAGFPCSSIGRTICRKTSDAGFFRSALMPMSTELHWRERSFR